MCPPTGGGCHLREHGAVCGIQPRQHLRREEAGVLPDKLQQR